MAKNLRYDWLTTDMVTVFIPVTKKHSIRIEIKEVYVSEKDGIYPPSLEIYLGERKVTDAYIKRNANQTIAPTTDNLKTAIELIEEAEYRMAERRRNADESTTNED